MKSSLFQQKKIFNIFSTVSENLLEKFPSRKDEIQKLTIDIEVSWMEIEVGALKRLDDLKSTLHRWTDYTENMREVMTWLRTCEGELKETFVKLDCHDLGSKLQHFQVLYNRSAFFFQLDMFVSENIEGS